MRIKEISNGRIVGFDSYGDFVKMALGPSDMDPESRHSRFVSNGNSWYGGSWDHAKQTAQTGDLVKAGKLRAGMIREANKIMGTVPRADVIYREEPGIWVDVSRFLSGEPEVWGDLVCLGETRRARQASIVFNACVNSDISSRDFERVASVMGASVLGLRSMGIQVSLFVVYKNQGHNGMHYDIDITSICLSSSDSFNTAQLAAVTNTWFFRRIVFAYWECRDAVYRKTHNIPGNYGFSQSCNMAEARHITGTKNPLLLNLIDMVDQTDDQIKNTILGVLNPEKAPS